MEGVSSKAGSKERDQDRLNSAMSALWCSTHRGDGQAQLQGGQHSHLSGAQMLVSGVGGLHGPVSHQPSNYSCGCGLNSSGGNAGGFSGQMMCPGGSQGPSPMGTPLTSPALVGSSPGIGSAQQRQQPGQDFRSATGGCPPLPPSLPQSLGAQQAYAQQGAAAGLGMPAMQQQQRMRSGDAALGPQRAASMSDRQFRAHIGGGRGGGPPQAERFASAGAANAQFNANAPIFAPSGGFGLENGCAHDGGLCGAVHHGGIGAEGAAAVPLVSEAGVGSMSLAPGQHLPPQQLQHFVAGAALVHRAAASRAEPSGATPPTRAEKMMMRVLDLPRLAAHKAGLRRTGQSSRHDAFFMPETLRAELAQRRAAAMHTGDPSDERLADVAGVVVRNFHSLVPMDDPSRPKRNRAHTSLYQATSEHDGEAYALRLLDGAPAPADAIRAGGHFWCSMQHPNIVRLHDVFTEGSDTLAGTWFVYDFHPNAVTLEWAYFVGRSVHPSEETLWNHALQLLAAMHAVHLAGAALRSLDAARIIMTDKNTIRISAAGLLDVTRPESCSRKQMAQTQAEDLQALGRLLLCFACASPMAAAPNAISKSMAYVCASFSPDLQHLLLLLLATPTPGGGPTVHDAVALVSGRMMTRVSQTQCLVDALQTELSKEMENGRLLRLLAKLQFVKERQVLGDDTEWGEHSDRYLLRLFSDAVFQQVDEEGRPVVDFAQLVNNFNKLDVGHEGRVLLSGQNDGALLLVSFRDIKAVLERSFEEITALADERGPS